MNTPKQIVKQCVEKSDSRFDLWIRLVDSYEVKSMAEVGVYKGDFAYQLLKKCDSIEKYFMIDPWRHLEDWSKPANKNNNTFEKFLLETKEKTNFAANKTEILRGKTTEVIEKIPNNTLDFAYIDGDHTLKGITIDLIRLFEKVRVGGWIGGDDFSQSIWQHTPNYEPTLIFPFAVYFAEAVGAKIYALPYSQFLIEKNEVESFSFIDLTGKYSNLELKSHFNPLEIFKIKMMDVSTFLTGLAK
ncbi:class I SAM-dependent methyltransferase [Pleurocapsa sp. FMAR1]|uniref:class I SAM-dependent methyltransferase n=1 Tax=Pleurocapsa sp. FMAR1 TaxID=3040204 RepID=UPI0029C97CF2|nr:class I SAM-dependent methyltransferase [Pleurocapsa sp. FMAR1]